jgi:hypothetical protein
VQEGIKRNKINYGKLERKEGLNEETSRKGKRETMTK